MHLHTHCPSAPVADVVDRYWLHQGGAPAHSHDLVLPGNCEELLINLDDGELRCYHGDGRIHGRTRGPILAGLHCRPYLIDTRQQSAIMGVKFRPGGVWSLLGIPASELTDFRVDLQTILGAESRELMDRLMRPAPPAARFAILDRALCARRRNYRHPAVVWAAAQVVRYPDSVKVGELASEAGLSARRFGEVFGREVGLSPKRFARLRRFRAALAHTHAATSPDWCALAVALGYADQAHFIREFREFSGLTPTAYHARKGPLAHLVPWHRGATSAPVPHPAVA